MISLAKGIDDFFYRDINIKEKNKIINQFKSDKYKSDHILMLELFKFALDNLDKGKFNNQFIKDVNQRYNYGSTVRDGKTWYLTADGINQLLYPNWDINTISVGKPRSPVWSQRDDWFFKTISWSDAGSNFLNGIVKLNQVLSNNIDGYWKNGNNIVAGVKGCLSPVYFLE